MDRKILSLAIAGLLLPAVANAATVTAGSGGFDDGWATSITYEDDNAVARRGITNDRDNPLNALGGPADGQFFELGFGSSADFKFGTLFEDTATVAEVTFGSTDAFPEFVDVFVGLGGNFTYVTTISNGDAATTATVMVGAGPFDTLRLVDMSPLTSTFESDALGPVGGFDIDAVRVAPVPLPAGILLLGTALGGLGIARRRKNKS